MLFAILGRQPKLSIAELESYFGGTNIAPFGETSATIKTDSASINSLGGTLKLAKLERTISTKNPLALLRLLEKYYVTNLPTDIGKITLGLSWYGDNIPTKIINQALLKIKGQMKRRGVNVRLLPVTQLALSTATSHHNGLGKNPKKIEIIVVKNHQSYIFGRSLGCQNISAYRDRDQKRPKRDSKVGMLPPKLAQIMVNLSRKEPFSNGQKLTLLDPFCGTGVILQEAHLMSFNIIGSDIEPRMITFSKENLRWLDDNLNDPNLIIGDGTKLTWPSFDCIASESYLGRPYATPPSTEQLLEEKNTVNGVVSGFLQNLRKQTLDDHHQICLAVPAWLRPDGHYEDLNIAGNENLLKLGFRKKQFENLQTTDLLYYREGQSVARRLLVLVPK